MKKASAAKKDQNEQKKTNMQAPCDNIADILLAGGGNRTVWPAPLRFPDCPSGQFHFLALMFKLPEPYGNAMQKGGEGNTKRWYICNPPPPPLGTTEWWYIGSHRFTNAWGGGGSGRI